MMSWHTPYRKVGGGIENLSLIPGEAGAAAIQNIGAYGNGDQGCDRECGGL